MRRWSTPAPGDVDPPGRHSAAALRNRGIRPPQVGKAFQAHLTRAKLPRIRLHDVRHSVASHLLARGVPLAAVASRMGHSVTTCEKTYRHYIPSADTAAAAVMAEVMHR